MITDAELAKLRALSKKPPLPCSPGEPTAEELKYGEHWFMTVSVLLPDLIAEVERMRDALKSCVAAMCTDPRCEGECAWRIAVAAMEQK
jgi:hypothetical protein